RRGTHKLAGIRSWLGAAAAALAAVGISGAIHADPAPKRSGFTPAPPLSALAIAPSNVRVIATPPAPEWQVTEGTIRRGRTLSDTLRADGVSPQVIHQIALALKGHFNFRRAKPGHSFKLVQDQTGTVLEFRYDLSPTQSLTVKRVGSVLQVSSDDGDLEAR